MDENILEDYFKTYVELVITMPTDALLLTWINFNPGMDNQSHAQHGVGQNYLSISQSSVKRA